MRQRVNAGEHFRRGNADVSLIVAGDTVLIVARHQSAFPCNPALNHAVLVNTAYSSEQLSDDKAAAAIVDAWETRVFSAAVAVAEKAGKPITLVGLPSGNRYETILQAAGALQSSRLVLDASSKDSIEEQSHDIRAAWTRLSEHRHAISVTIAGEDGAKPRCFTLDDAAGPK